MKYLLGTLSEEERTRFEEKYFSDDAEFEEIEIAEEELIDRYVRGELSQTDQKFFESMVVGSSRLRMRVDFARTLAEKLRNSPLERPQVDKARFSWPKLFGLSAVGRGPQFALAASVLIVMVGGIALFAGWLKLRQESKRLFDQQAVLEQRRHELDKRAADLENQLAEIAKQLPPPTTSETAPKQTAGASPEVTRSFVTLTLSPGITRGGGVGNEIRISAGIQQVHFTLRLSDSDYSSYEATIDTAERKTVFTSASLRVSRTSSGPALQFSSPAQRLAQGDYVIRVKGTTEAGVTESVADYSFRVLR